MLIKSPTRIGLLASVLLTSLLLHRYPTPVSVPASNAC